MPESTTSQRKDAHLDLCATQDVAPRENSALFECVKLVHCAMPEARLDDVSLEVELFGKRLKAPLFITGMTGGSERAAQVNRDLATAAEQFGIAFGVGSQRAMSESRQFEHTFAVRQVAPTTVVVGNIGLRQAAALGTDGVRKLTDTLQADGLALHLNVGQELTQPEGDRDFRHGYATVAALAKVYAGRLLVKETGCGISGAVARRLYECGVQHIDVSGLGGTSWIKVEQLRSSGAAAEVGEQFSGWGIPTAAAVASVRRSVPPEVTLIASGGVRTGLDVAKAIALGADLAGLALPLFRAQQSGGAAGVVSALQTLTTGLKHAMLLTGATRVAQLKRVPKAVAGELKDWLGAV